MKHSLIPSFIFIMFFWIVQNNFANGSPENDFFKIDSITNEIELNKNWKYHPGDDTLWAGFDYDDHDWDTTLQTTLDLLDTPENKFTGLCWFRLHFQIDSSLTNKTYALLMKQQGASEIYLNGKLIKSFGKIGDSIGEEETTNPKLLPGILQFEDSLNYVLAVRYSNLKALRNLKIYRNNEAGFTLSVKNHEKAIQNLFGQFIASYIVLFLVVIFLVLSITHFLLFIFYQKQKSNLYYSIFMLLFSGLIFYVLLSNGVNEYPPLLNKAGFIISMIFPLFFLPLTGFLYSLFMDKIPRIFWITTGIAIILSFLYLFDVSFISGLYIGFVFLLWIEVTRVVIMAMIKKHDGAWIIGIGVLFFIVFFTFILIHIIRYGDLVLDNKTTLALVFGLSVVAAILSIPLSMSIYLARDFARTNKNLEKQLENVKMLSAKTLEQEREKQRILENQKEKLEVMVDERTKELAQEKEKTEELLLNTLPLKVVNELKENGKSEPESFENVTVYFSDIVGFTNISSSLEPNTLISELSDMFTVFDDIMTKFNCERIKTIGDAYLAVSGMPLKNDEHAENMIKAATEIRNYLNERNKTTEVKWRIRIGIHSGKVVGGIVGVRKYIYDVFGDTINTASRMESNSESMRINVSEATYSILKEKFSFIERDAIEVKGKGNMKMYFLDV